MKTAIPQTFHQFRLERSIPFVRLGCVLAAVTTVAFIPVDEVYLHGPIAELIHSFRLWFLLPVIGVWTVLTFTPLRKWIYGIIFFSGLPVGLAFIYAGYESDRMREASAMPQMVDLTLVGDAHPIGMYYAGIALAQICYIAISLFSLPPRYALTFSLITLGAFAYAANALELTLPQTVLALSSATAITALSLVTAARSDIREWRLYRTLKDLHEANSNHVRMFKDRVDYIRHETRTSFANVDASVFLLKADATDSDELVLLDRAERNLKTVQEVLTTATEANSIESAILVPSEKVDVVGLVNEIVADYHADPRGISIEQKTGTERSVYQDKRQFTQLMQNLIENAIRYEDGSSPIVVEVIDQGEDVLFRVTNSGRTLPENTANLFKIYYRGDSSGSGGTGLGLWAVKKIAEHMGGRVEAESMTQPEGARFTITLPAASKSLARRLRFASSFERVFGN